MYKPNWKRNAIHYAAMQIAGADSHTEMFNAICFAPNATISGIRDGQFFSLSPNQAKETLKQRIISCVKMMKPYMHSGVIGYSLVSVSELEKALDVIFSTPNKYQKLVNDINEYFLANDHRNAKVVLV